MPLPQSYQSAIDRISKQLPNKLGENLYSCILYGSTVRDSVVRGVSDINVLIVLNYSTPDAHAAIADCIEGDIKIAPFVVARKGMQRSFAVFAIKFRSIKRHYKVLCGTDPIKDFDVDNDKIKFLVEQALRNLRFRSVNNFILNRKNKQHYTRFIQDSYTAVFTYVGEIIRLADIEVPGNYKERIALISDYFKTDVNALHELVKIQADPGIINENTIPIIHELLFNFLNGIVTWMEEHW